MALPGLPAPLSPSPSVHAPSCSGRIFQRRSAAAGPPVPAAGCSCTPLISTVHTSQLRIRMAASLHLGTHASRQSVHAMSRHDQQFVPRSHSRRLHYSSGRMDQTGHCLCQTPAPMHILHFVRHLVSVMRRPGSCSHPLPPCCTNSFGTGSSFKRHLPHWQPPNNLGVSIMLPCLNKQMCTSSVTVHTA